MANLTPEQRGVRAQQILEDEIFKEGIVELRKAYVEAFSGCDAKDDLGRFRYSVALNSIGVLEKHLRAVLMTGELAAKRAQELQTDTIAKRITRIF